MTSEERAAQDKTPQAEAPQPEQNAQTAHQRPAFGPTNDPTETQPICIPPETLAAIEAAQDASPDPKATQELRIPNETRRQEKHDRPGTSQETRD